MKRKEKGEFVLARVFYPLILIVTSGICYFALEAKANLENVYGYYLSILVFILVLSEHYHPLRTHWKMNRTLFFKRDLPYILLGASTLAIANAVVGYFAINFSSHSSSWDMPLLFDLFIALLLFDFFWYWYHRWCHENTGKVGTFLWNIHIAHHLPQQVYVLMHGVSHPLNTIIARTIMNAPLFLLGFSAEVIFLVNVFASLQTMMSHYNVDIRAGWLNYFIIGTELHRYHHSANPMESYNYGSVLTIWDHMFGTFYYRPNNPPAKLGVNDAKAYPKETEFVKILLLPFRNWRS